MSNNYDFSFSDDTINTSDINTESLFDGNTSDSLFGGSVHINTDEIPSDTFSLEFSGGDSQTYADMSDSLVGGESDDGEDGEDGGDDDSFVGGGLTDVFSESAGSEMTLDELESLLNDKLNTLTQNIIAKYDN